MNDGSKVDGLAAALQCALSTADRECADNLQAALVAWWGAGKPGDARNVLREMLTAIDAGTETARG